MGGSQINVTWVIEVLEVDGLGTGRIRGQIDKRSVQGLDLRLYIRHAATRPTSGRMMGILALRL